MDGYGRQPRGIGADVPDAEPSGGLSRREFARRAGIGSVAAAGFVWATPKISTFKAVRQAAVGSPSPPVTGQTTPIGPLGGEVTVSSTDACAGDSLRVIGTGFVPATGVAVQLDTASNPIGIATADTTGSVDVAVVIPAATVAGDHTLRLVGVQTGGRTITVTHAITVATAEACAEGSVTPVGAAGSPSGADGGGSGGGGSGGGRLPFTGSDATDLALLGGAAVVGGAAIYNTAKQRRHALDEAEPQ